MDKIKMLKDGVNNSILLLYTECLKQGLREEDAKSLVAETVERYASNISKDDITNSIKENILMLQERYKASTEENEKYRVYNQINKLQDALEVFEEVRLIE